MKTPKLDEDDVSDFLTFLKKINNGQKIKRPGYMPKYKNKTDNRISEKNQLAKSRLEKTVKSALNQIKIIKQNLEKLETRIEEDLTDLRNTLDNSIIKQDVQTKIVQNKKDLNQSVDSGIGESFILDHDHTKK